MMLSAFIINSILVVTCVVIHYEFLRLMSYFLNKQLFSHRIHIIFGVLGALLAHCLEVWVFAFGFYFMIHHTDLGYLKGDFTGSLIDCVYYSFITYSSLGFGDILPVGYIRFVSALEVLTGLVLVSWTASFLFLEMQKLWFARPANDK